MTRHQCSIHYERSGVAYSVSGDKVPAPPLVTFRKIENRV